MRMEQKIVNIIFDAGKGHSPVSSREGVCGEAYGALPTPTRSGYAFAGWYLGEMPVSESSILEADADVRLTAHWEKKVGEKKKHSVLRAQGITCIVLAACILFLSVGIAVANNLVAIYYLTDRYYDASGVEQSDRYTIKRQNGVYKLFNRSGDLMEFTENGYTLSDSDGTQTRYEVYVAEKSGNQYLINTKTGEYETYAVVDYDADMGESLGGTVKAKRVMMFPRVGQDNTYSIEVKNQSGTYKLYRSNVKTDENGSKYTTSIVVSKEGEDTIASYDPTLFASLCVSCGYTLTLKKLDFSTPGAPLKADGSIDYAEYGLENRYDENGTLVYTPTTYTITKAAYAANGSCSPATEKFDFDGDPANGKETERVVQYTVMVGDALVSDGGYYVRLVSNYANPNSEGREAVYIVSNSIASTVLEPVESLVTPSLVYPMSTTTYVMVYNFRFGTLNQYMDVPEDQLESQLKLISAFDYVDLAERENTMYSSTPYLVSPGVTLMNGYRFNGDNVSTVLGNIYQMEYVGCRVIRPDEEDIKEYKLDENVYFISFDYDPLVASGGSESKDDWINSMIIISQMTENGTYYVYSAMYDMIVEVDRYYLSFLDWDANDWYEDSVFQNNISHIKSMTITTGSQLYRFELDNRFSYAFYDNGDGTGTLIDSSKGTFRQNADGSYTFIVTKTGAQHDVQFMDFSAGRTERVTYTTSNNTQATKIVYRAPSGITVDVSENTNNLRIIYAADASGGSYVDYTLTDTYVNDKGETETDTYTALDNFKRLYGHWLWYSFEGVVSEKELGSDVQTYIANNSCTVSLRYELEDMATILNPENYTTDVADAEATGKHLGNNKQSVIIRFYQYNGLRALVTVEVLANESATPDPTKAQGAFYVNARELDQILGYTQDFVNGTLVPNSFD